ncbi:canalicular multispecific organic anion transporter 2 [Trichonephila clavipes]|nr:canalicular multispecific organic anion transporter 2 [Trichonephila clavipes]
MSDGMEKKGVRQFIDGPPTLPTPPMFMTEHGVVGLLLSMMVWLKRIIWHGYRNLFEADKLDPLGPKKRAAYVFQRFYNYWSKEENIAKSLSGDENETSAQQSKCCRREPSLLLSIMKAMWPWVLAAALMEIIYNFITLAPPIILDYLIAFIGNDEEEWHGYVYAILLFLAACCVTLSSVHNQNFLIIASVYPRTGLQTAIYRKVLRLSSNSRRCYTIGELCNLVAVDAQKIFELIWIMNLTWSCPMRIILIVALLWRYLGIASLAGVFVMVLIMPITTKLASVSHKLQKKQMEWKDSRLRQMSEILNGIKVLKLFAWEIPFLKSINRIREKEAVTLRKLAFINGSIVFIWTSALFLYPQDESGGNAQRKTPIQRCSYDDDLRRTTFSSIDRVTAEVEERFQKFRNLPQNYAFLWPEVILSMDKLNFDQAPQDINKEDFELERIRLQVFVAATDPGCKKELIRSVSLGLLKYIIESRFDDGLPSIVIMLRTFLTSAFGNVSCERSCSIYIS